MSHLTSQVEKEQSECFSSLCESSQKLASSEVNSPASFDYWARHLMRGPTFNPNPKGDDVKVVVFLLNKDLPTYTTDQPKLSIFIRSVDLKRLSLEGWSPQLRKLAQKMTPLFFGALREYKESPQSVAVRGIIDRFFALFEGEGGKQFINSWDMKTFSLFVQFLFLNLDESDQNAIDEIFLREIRPVLNALDMYLVMRGLSSSWPLNSAPLLCQMRTIQKTRDHMIPKYFDLIRDRLLRTLERELGERKWEAKVDPGLPLKERLARYCEMKGSNEILCEDVQSLPECVFEEGLVPGSTGYKLAQASFKAQQRVLGKRKS